MFKFFKLVIVPAFSFLFLHPLISIAQVDDIGAWFGVTVQGQLTRRLEASISEQIRFHHDVTEINGMLTDVGIEYSITNKLKAGVHYRFINSNRDNYYSKRHRVYIDVSWKEKIKFVTFSLRERIQEQFNDYYSSENGKIPTWTLRSKLSAKFDINKKYAPYLSTEVYYLLDNVEEASGITRFRYETGISYDFNRIHSINPFILFQHSRSTGFNDLIYGIMYSYTH